MNRWRNRIVVVPALLGMLAFGVPTVTHIIRPDFCGQICDSVRAGETSWWLALAMGCWCGDDQADGAAHHQHGTVCRASSPRLSVVTVK